MSASRQKKLRQEKNETVSETKKRKLTEEQKAARQLKVWSVVFYIVIAAMLLGLAVAAFVNSGVLQRSMTAVTVGEHKLSAAEVNFFYRDTVSNDYLLPYIVDSSKTLDEQQYSEGVTFADHYMEEALKNAATTYAIYDEAMANGFQLSEEDQEELDTNMATMETYASAYGYSSVSGLLRANYGVGCNEKTYEKYQRVNKIATAYAQQCYDGLTATDEEIAADIEENRLNYTSFSYSYLTYSVSDYYEGEADEEGKYTDEQTEAAKAAALKAAEEKAAALKGNVEAMEAEEGVTNGSKVLYSQVPAAMQEWISADSRTEGETAALEAGSGSAYYVVMFMGSDDNASTKLVNVRHILIAPDAEASSSSYTEEQIAQARASAEEVLASWKAGEATEDSFAVLANEKSTDTGSNTNGGLYENVYPGQMVQTFNDWCFDESRKPGDTGLVETTYGVHIMYYVGESDQTYQNYQAESAIIADKYETWYDGASEGYAPAQKAAMCFVKKDVAVQAASYGG